MGISERKKWMAKKFGVYAFLREKCKILKIFYNSKTLQAKKAKKKLSKIIKNW